MSATIVRSGYNREFRVKPGGDIQDALDAARVNGGTVYLEAGQHSISTGLTINYKGFTDGLPPSTVNIIGAGSGVTELLWQPASAGTMLTATGNALFHSNVIQGIRFRANVAANATTAYAITGLSVSEGAFAEYHDLWFEGLDIGTVTQDFLSTRFINCRWRNCRSGLEILDQLTTSPGNALSFFGCQWGSNEEKAITATGAGQLQIFGGSIEGNGWALTADEDDRHGVRLITSGSSGMAAALFGVWFENNARSGDIRLVAGDTYPSLLSLHGCTFIRAGASAVGWSTNNIRVDAVASNQPVTVHVNGCSFRGIGTYTPDAGRPYLEVVGDGEVKFTGSGNYFDALAERHTTRVLNDELAVVRFDGTASTPITATFHHNITGGTVTKNGTGDYTFGLDIPGRGSHTVHVAVNGQGIGYVYSDAETSISIRTANLAGDLADFSSVMVRVGP